jgi:hypothetical protein
MTWVGELTGRWLSVLRASGREVAPLDEAVRLISGITATAEPGGRPGRSRRRAGVSQAPDGAVVTTLSRQLVAGLLAGDLLLTRLCRATGQSREQVVDTLARDLADWLRVQQLEVLLVELSADCQALREVRSAPYDALGERVQRVLQLAQEEARDLVAEARAEAAAIRAAAGRPENEQP